MTARGSAKPAPGDGGDGWPAKSSPSHARPRGVGSGVGIGGQRLGQLVADDLARAGARDGVDEVDRVDVGYLPADIDQNGSTLPLDNTLFRGMFVGAFANPKGIDEDYADINRDGSMLPLDITVWRANFNSWNFRNLPPRP